MNINEFLSKHEVLDTKNRVSIHQLGELEAAMDGARIGPQLKEYILEHGFLVYEYVELYGINSKQYLNSDMVKQTVYLHKYYPKTIGYVALENRGEGEYAIVDNEDFVYLFISETGEIKDTDLRLFDYIVNRFADISRNV